MSSIAGSNRPTVTVSVSRAIEMSGHWLGAFEALRSHPFPWLLESALPSSRLGRSSFAGSDPYLVMRAFGSRCEIDCLRGVWPGLEVGHRTFEADPLEVFRALLPASPHSGPERDGSQPPFIGGAVGYLGYELSETFEPLGLAARDDLGVPDLFLLFVDRLLVFDEVGGGLSIWALGFGEDRHEAQERADDALVALERDIRQPPESLPPKQLCPSLASAAIGTTSSFDEMAYVRAIEVSKREIELGNAYQVCLSHREERAFDGDSWNLYKSLRRINPAPFASYFELPNLSVVGSSPERFLLLDTGRQVESRPIKGTCARGRHPAEDEANRCALVSSEKDRAENLMIVDLVRNDLGRVCETGSVAVPELMIIEPYASVFQMVSSVTGRLRRDLDAIDLIRATFPPGSMTGAPKISAMQILDRLEPVRRGVYSGASGYFDVRGGLDLCVVIRTLLLRDGCAYVHSGGGIVADSEPGAEYRETLDKSEPLFAALDASDR